MNLDNRSKKYVVGKKKGFCAIETSIFSDMIFTAQLSENPKIHIFDGALNKIGKIAKVTRFEILAMTYDHYKNLLFVACGAPEYIIKIVDVSERKCLITKEDTKLEITKDFKSMHVCPTSPHILAVVESKVVKFCQFLPHFSEKYSKIAHSDFEVLNLTLPMLFRERFENEKLNDEYFSFYWLSDQFFVLSTKSGKIVFFSFKSFEVIKTFEYSKSSPSILGFKNEIFIFTNEKFD